MFIFIEHTCVLNGVSTIIFRYDFLHKTIAENENFVEGSD